MADREWQRAVLREIGTSGAGLVTTDSPPATTQPPVPSDASSTSRAPASSSPPAYWAGDRGSVQVASAAGAQQPADYTATILDFGTAGLRDAGASLSASTAAGPAVPPASLPSTSVEADPGRTATFKRPSSFGGRDAASPSAPPAQEPAVNSWYAEPSPVTTEQQADQGDQGSGDIDQAGPAVIGAAAREHLGAWQATAPGPELPSAPGQSPPTAAPGPYASTDGPPAGQPVAEHPLEYGQPPVFSAQPTAMAAPSGAYPMAAPSVPMDALVRKNPHGDPLMRRLGSNVRKAVGSGAAANAREQAELQERLTRRVSTCRQIAVVSVRGGAGKTTIAALAATAIAELRQDRVLAVDADSTLGSLPLRLGVRPERTLHDLAPAAPRNWEETAAFLTRSRENLWVLPGSLEGRMTAELNLETFRAAFGGLGRYFSTAMIDCGAGILGTLQLGILETSHAQLFVTPGTVDGALSARGALDWFAANGHGALLQRTVIVLVTHTPHADANLQRVQEMLGAGRVPVIHLPYDRHVATGTAIDMARIAAATRTAATRIAAEVFTRSAGG